MTSYGLVIVLLVLLPGIMEGTVKTDCHSLDLQVFHLMHEISFCNLILFFSYLQRFLKLGMKRMGL